MLSRDYVESRINELRSIQLQKQLDLEVLKGQLGELEFALNQIKSMEAEEPKEETVSE